MAPKAKLGTAPIYHMGHEEQVRLLSDALLREYMHRRGFTKTLQKFDEEHPRDGETVSSRAVMSDLMALTSSDQQRLKGEGIETIMEMLCSLRVERRLATESLKAQISKPIPEVPEMYLRLIARQDEQKALKKKEREQTRREGRLEEVESKVNSIGVVSSKFPISLSNVPAVPLTVSRARKSAARSSSHSLFHAPPLTGKEKPSLHDSLPFSTGDHRGEIPLVVEKEMTMDELLYSDSDTRGEEDGRNPMNKELRKGSRFSEGAKGGAQAREGIAAREQREWEDRPFSSSLSVGNSSRDKEKKEWSNLKTAKGEENVSSDIQNYRLEEVGEKYEEMCSDSVPSSAEELRQVFYVLCGEQHGAPPSSVLKQGIRFSDASGACLIQWEKGPSAVISAIQAFVAGFYFERPHVIEGPEWQLRSVVKALAYMLQRAQPNVQKIVVVDGLLRLQAPSKFFLQQLGTQYKQWSNFRDIVDVERRIEMIFSTHWGRPKGSGMWCFLLSLLLSRGVCTVKADGGSLPLIDASSGAGSRGLFHLCLCGVCKDTLPSSLSTRLTFQCGLVDKDESDSSSAQLASSPSSSSVHANALAFLVKGDRELSAASENENNLLEEGSKSFSSGTRLSPIFPSWVIKSGEHYYNIFMKRDTRKEFEEQRALGFGGSAALTFWDVLKGEEELTAQVKGHSGGLFDVGPRRSLSSASFVERAILTIPQWRGAVVDWNRQKPVL